MLRMEVSLNFRRLPGIAKSLLKSRIEAKGFQPEMNYESSTSFTVRSLREKGESVSV